MISLYDARVTDALGGAYREDPKIRALGYAIRAGTRLLYDHALKATTYNSLEQMDDKVLDLLAAELRSPYYDIAYDKAVKADLVRNTMRWYQIAGTRRAMEELGAAVFGQCDVEEWYEYEGEPYHFRIITQALASSDNVAAFEAIMRSVKNARSKLDSVSILRVIDTGGSNCVGFAFSVTSPPPIHCAF